MTSVEEALAWASCSLELLDTDKTAETNTMQVSEGMLDGKEREGMEKDMKSRWRKVSKGWGEVGKEVTGILEKWKFD